VLISVWNCEPFPSKVTSINYNSYKGKDFADWIDTEDEEEIEMYAVQPIPLIPEILEKNGFVRQDGDEYYKEVYSYQKRKTEELEEGDIEYYIDLRRHPINETFEFEEGFVMGGTDDNDEPYGKCTFECNFIYDIRYVHELQHAIKQHGNDKEIAL
jgi:hypothetical protein